MNSPPLSQSKPRKGKGSLASTSFICLSTPASPLTPDRALFGPAGGDINEIKRIHEHTGDGIAAMSDSIGLKESGAQFIPLISINGYAFTKQGARFSC